MLQLLKRVINVDKELKDCAEQINHLKLKLNEKRKSEKTYFESKEIKVPTKEFEVKVKLESHSGKVYGVNWHHDSKHLFSIAQDARLIVWDTCSKTIKKSLNLSNSWMLASAVSPSGTLTAVGGLDNLCTIYDVSDAFGLTPMPKEESESDQGQYILQGHEGYVSSCKFLNEDTIVTTSGDLTVGYWNITKERIISTSEGHTGDVMSVCVDPSSHLVITGSFDSTAKVWDDRTPKKWMLNFAGFHTSDINWLNNITFFKKKKTVCVYVYIYVYIYVLLFCTSVHLFPNKRSFVTGSDDSTCRLFDLRAYRQMAIYSNRTHTSVQMVDTSVSGCYIFVDDDDANSIIALNTLNTKEVYVLTHTQRARRMQVSPSGHALATGCWDFHIRLWA
ncbi:guanine nucleotide-binding protein beta 1 4 (G protein beta1 4) [Reticulomyxa filosa]|uniref:Guanine nucleotide-binding protein beta 1 4 (G protein beta1 4) n=1 Tax=Reticulomyxa filosa TaxID=46433 RepID=X6P1Q9_RETFI|nr:guanine nucleotide-binding protein beta 1 4 (G protein beta1 4) [Reticulomyxa filosa]|eukprot:ETO32176.1 guanine nucleotide-binding protein beta 1 4 (G protein beta1 4) [Reticulomyxa filosa]